MKLIASAAVAAGFATLCCWSVSSIGAEPSLVVIGAQPAIAMSSVPASADIQVAALEASHSAVAARTPADNMTAKATTDYGLGDVGPSVPKVAPVPHRRPDRAHAVEHAAVQHRTMKVRKMERLASNVAQPEQPKRRIITWPGPFMTGVFR